MPFDDLSQFFGGKEGGGSVISLATEIVGLPTAVVYYIRSWVTSVAVDDFGHRFRYARPVYHPHTGWSVVGKNSTIHMCVPSSH